MLTFLFAWMGSMLFWGGYVFASIFVGTMLLRLIAKRTYKWIKTGERPVAMGTCTVPCDLPATILAGIAVYLFWPFILVGLALYFGAKILLIKFFWSSFKVVFNAVDKSIPNVKVETNNY